MKPVQSVNYEKNPSFDRDIMMTDKLLPLSSAVFYFIFQDVLGDMSMFLTLETGHPNSGSFCYLGNKCIKIYLYWLTYIYNIWFS